MSARCSTSSGKADTQPGSGRATRQRNKRHGDLAPLRGIISLSPCRDGTLFASVFRRSVRQESTGDHWLFTAEDSLGMYTAPCDVKPGSLGVGSWTPCKGAAMQVQKMPIPCWSLFEGLKADFQTKAIMRQA